MRLFSKDFYYDVHEVFVSVGKGHYKQNYQQKVFDNNVTIQGVVSLVLLGVLSSVQLLQSYGFMICLEQSILLLLSVLFIAFSEVKPALRTF